MSADNNEKKRYENREVLELFTRTPVFVGTGNEIRPISFIRDNNKLLIMPEDFVDRLPVDLQSKYLEWIEPIIEQLSNIGYRLATVNNDELRRGLNDERRRMENRLSLEQFLRNQGNSQNLMQTLHPRIVGFHEFPQNGFREHIKHPDGLPYIPGSEIKGALRNAVLFAMLNDQKYNGTLKQYLQAVQAAPQNERGRQLQKVAEKTESALLRTQGHADDAKYDLLRFVSISDTQPFTQQSALYIEKTRAVNTNRNTVMYLEAVYSDQGSATFEIRYGAPEKVISEINLTELRDWLKPERLLKACYEYSNAILDEEAGYFQNTFPNEKISGKIEYLKKENEEKRPLLRLGAGQGFLSVTIDLKVKQRDPQLYELIRKIASNISRRRWNTYQYNFPKTRRVIVTDNEPDTLLGWVKIVRTQSNSEKEAKSGS